MTKVGFGSKNERFLKDGFDIKKRKIGPTKMGFAVLGGGRINFKFEVKSFSVAGSN